MIGRVKTNPVTGVKYAETLAGPTGGTVQKLGLNDDCDYEVVLSAGDRDVDGESYVGVSTCCPVTYNPSTGTFKVCTLEAESVNGNIDADRIREYDKSIFTENARRAIPFTTNAVNVDGKTYTCAFEDINNLYYCYGGGATSVLSAPQFHSSSGVVTLAAGDSTWTVCGRDSNNALYIVTPDGKYLVYWTTDGCYHGNVCGTAACTYCARMFGANKTSAYNNYYSLITTNVINATSTAEVSRSLCYVQNSSLSYNPYLCRLCVASSVWTGTSHATYGVYCGLCLGNSSDVCIYAGDDNFLCDYNGCFIIGFGADVSTNCEYKWGMAIGNYSFAGTCSMAIGTYANASSCSMAIGYCAVIGCDGKESTAIGRGTRVNSPWSLAIDGYIACPNACFSTAIGGSVYGAAACCATLVGIGAVANCAGQTYIGADAGKCGNSCEAYTTGIGVRTGTYCCCGIYFNVYQRMGSRSFKFTMRVPQGTLHCNFQKGWHCFIRNFACTVDTASGYNHTYRWVGYGMEAYACDNYNDPLMAASGGVTCGNALTCVVCWWRSNCWGTFSCTDTSNSWFSRGGACYDYLMTISG